MIIFSISNICFIEMLSAPKLNFEIGYIFGTLDSRVNQFVQSDFWKHWDLELSYCIWSVTKTDIFLSLLTSTIEISTMYFVNVLQMKKT